MDNCCCAKAVRALWTIQLPLQVRSHVADMAFNKDTYKTVFASADKVYLSTKSTEVSAGVAAISAPQPVDEVAAVRGQRQNRGGRGRGNGRGGSSSNRGGSSNQNNSNPPRRPKPTVPDGCCSNHKKWASDAWFCLEPLTCPLVNKCSAKPAGENKN